VVVDAYALGLCSLSDSVRDRPGDRSSPIHLHFLVGYLVYDHEAEIAERLTDKPLGVNTLEAHPSVEINQIYDEKLYQAISLLLEQTP